jgi:hypothetical protein
VLLLASASLAQTLTLFRFGNGVYDYELTVPPHGTITLVPGTAIVLSWLWGVTGATVSGALTNGGADPEGCGLKLSSFRSTKVALTQPSDLSLCVFAAPSSSSPGQFPTLEVTAPSTTLGTVKFTLYSAGGNVTGTIQGPSPFVGTPGAPSCNFSNVSALVLQYGEMARAATALGYASLAALQTAVVAFCDPGG